MVRVLRKLYTKKHKTKIRIKKRNLNNTMLHIFTYCTNKDNVKLLEKTAQLKNIPLN
jgi:hypothetical protein